MAYRVTCPAIFLLICLVWGASGQKVVELDEDNWSQILKGEWMVEFYAPWCPACKALEGKWKDFAQSGPALGVKIGAVDVTTSPGLSGRFMVTALPTIFHVLDGQFRQYKGSRDVDSFSLFVEDRKWEQVDPISSWKAPNSLQMSFIASFFKLSQSLRHIHNKFTNEYGLPTLASYLIFAIATIIIGACLGLILVCAIDLLYPQKPTQHVVYLDPASKKNLDKDSGDEFNDEDIKDDLVDQPANSEEEQVSSESEGSQKEAKEEGGDSGKARKRKPKRDM